jgi:ABC-type polysaccharide/polyol phosphate export permease
VAVEVPATPSGTDPPEDGGEHEGYGLARPVADASPMAAQAAGMTAREARGHKVTRVVSPTIGIGQRLREIWLCRELLVYLVRTEIKVKYKNSVLGLVWSMISPAMTLAIYFIVFQYIAKNGIPHFVIFLYSGLLLWNLFQLGVQTGTGVIVNNAGIIKKVSFPREILALAAVGSAGVFFFFQAIVMVIFLFAFHAPPAWDYLPLIPLALLAAVVMAAGLAVLLCSINVYLRDTQHLIEVVLTAWFWACPIVYSFQTQLAAKLARYHLTWTYFLNPMTPLVFSFQRALYAHVRVHLTNAVKGSNAVALLPLHGFLWYATLDVGVLVAGVILFLIALVVFGRLEGNFAEEL